MKSHEIIEESMAVNRYHVLFLVAFQQTLALHIRGLKKNDSKDLTKIESTTGASS